MLLLLIGNMDFLGSKKVLILDGVDSCCAGILKSANFIVEVRPTMPKDQLIVAIKVYNVPCLLVYTFS